MEKTKNFEEYLGITKEEVSEGLHEHADWVDLDLLQNTIERMRSEEYKQALAELNEKFPMPEGVKIKLPPHLASE